jgi:hypothetical protein
MNQSLGGPLPFDVSLYHKIGILYAPFSTWNDAGIIVADEDGDERAYVIAYLGSYSPDWDWAYWNAYAASSSTWSWFSSAYPSHGAVPRPPLQPDARATDVAECR